MCHGCAPVGAGLKVTGVPLGDCMEVPPLAPRALICAFPRASTGACASACPQARACACVCACARAGASCASAARLAPRGVPRAHLPPTTAAAPARGPPCTLARGPRAPVHARAGAPLSPLGSPAGLWGQRGEASSCRAGRGCPRRAPCLPCQGWPACALASASARACGCATGDCRRIGGPCGYAAGVPSSWLKLALLRKSQRQSSNQFLCDSPLHSTLFQRPIPPSILPFTLLSPLLTFLSLTRHSSSVTP